MRKLFFISLITINLFACSNKKEASIKKTWIGSNMQYLKINDTSFCTKGSHMEGYYSYALNNNTLSLSYHDWMENRAITIYYKILRLTNDSLILKPFQGDSKKLLRDSSTLYYIDSIKKITPSIRLEKISYYRQGGSLGSAPIRIEIDSVGAVFFSGEIDSAKRICLYQGKLKLSDLTKLKSILQRSYLDDFPIDLESASDASWHRFVIHYNGKKKESTGSMIPYYGMELCMFMENIYKKIDLTEYKEAHSFEDELGNPYPPPMLVRELRVKAPTK
jgi:hypothetical protein